MRQKCGRSAPRRRAGGLGTAADLGSDFYATRIDPERRKRSHIRQLEALGYIVTLQPAA
jgi:hypothetical protein